MRLARDMPIFLLTEPGYILGTNRKRITREKEGRRVNLQRRLLVEADCGRRGGPVTGAQAALFLVTEAISCHMYCELQLARSRHAVALSSCRSVCCATANHACSLGQFGTRLKFFQSSRIAQVPCVQLHHDLESRGDRRLFSGAFSGSKLVGVETSPL
jgi:hypothetical protein